MNNLQDKYTGKRFNGRGATKGFEYLVVQESEAGFLIQVSQPIGKDFYEVWRRKYTTKFDWETKQKTAEKVLHKPPLEAFGIWAWCYTSEERAAVKWASLSLSEQEQEQEQG